MSDSSRQEGGPSQGGSGSPPKGIERRLYVRFEIVLPIEMKVAMAGQPATTMRGKTINVSRGGVLAEIPRAVRTGSRCRVTFLHSDKQVGPAQRSGKVVHVGTWHHGKHTAAVQFDEPLDYVEDDR